MSPTDRRRRIAQIVAKVFVDDPSLGVRLTRFVRGGA